MACVRVWAAVGAGLLAGCLSVPDADQAEASSGAGTTTGGECQVGFEGCPCSPDGTCLSSLVCQGGVCVGEGTTTDTTTSTATTVTPVTTEASETTPGSTSTDSGGTDTTGGVGTTAVDTGMVSAGSSSTGEPFVHEIFVTDQQIDGDQLGGIAGAASYCAQTYGSGTWEAVLRTDAITFQDHISITGPVYLLDGTQVTANAQEFFGSQFAVPVRMTENMSLVSLAARVWVGTTTEHCTGWSDGGEEGANVRVDENDEYLSPTATSDCGSAHRIFCVSQP